MHISLMGNKEGGSARHRAGARLERHLGRRRVSDASGSDDRQLENLAQLANQLEDGSPALDVAAGLDALGDYHLGTMFAGLQG